MLAPVFLAMAAASPLTPAPVFPYDSCGHLVPGALCPVIFMSDQGRMLVLDDYGTFQLGDYVHVAGDYDPGCNDACNEGDGCVHSNTITLCNAQDLGTNYCGPASLNSTGQAAVMSATGQPEAASNNVLLAAEQMPPNEGGYFLTSMTQGFGMPPGAQGNLCLAGSIGRFNSVVLSTGATGTFELQIDLTAIPTAPPSVVQPGETWSFQAWFRDHNPGTTSNFTDGLAITFL